MTTATIEEAKGCPRIVTDLRAIEGRLRAVSRVDAEAIERIITEIVGPESPGNRFYKGYRGVSRWL
jgi:hypothetical protein